MSQSNSSCGYSHSRARIFDECRRRYYWHYYGSRGGAFKDAPPQAQHAYTLKQLTTPHLVLGQEVHKRAAEIALAISTFSEEPNAEEMYRRCRNEIHRVSLASKNRNAFLRRPRYHPMYQHVYYGFDISNDRWLLLRDKLQSCINNLVASPHWSRVRECHPGSIKLFDSLEPVEVEGHQLYAAPDLLYQDRGVWEIVDYKTGSDDGAEEQIALYALYLMVTGAIPDFRGYARGRVITLATGLDYTIDITPEHIAGARARLQKDMWRFRQVLVECDAARNEALPLQWFPIRPDTSACTWCPYAEVCAPDLARVEYAGPLGLEAP